MQAFWLALVMVFVAELGDKTQLVALTLAARYRAGVVLAGVLVATLAVHLFSTALGGIAGELLPTAWIKLIAGLAFLAFAAWTLRGDELGDDPGARRPGLSPFWLTTVTFFLAELGDKTMLSTVTLAAGNPFVPIWIGSSLGMVLSDGLAIIVGQVLGAKLPERAIKMGAAAIFFGFGLYSLYAAGPDLAPIAWGAGGLVTAASALLLARGRRQARVGEPV